MLFHGTMHLSSGGTAGAQQVWKADLWFHVYKCISKLDFTHMNFEDVWPKVLFPFHFIVGSYLVITVAGHHVYPWAAAINKCQFLANEFGSFSIFLWWLFKDDKNHKSSRLVIESLYWVCWWNNFTAQLKRNCRVWGSKRLLIVCSSPRNWR